MHIARHLSAPICREYFCSAFINYHSSRPAFSPPKSPKNTCAREKNQSEQQKIRSLITENPPSRNRKSRFASALITIHRPPFSASALMSLEATRTQVRGRPPRSGLICLLCSLCSLCSRGKRQAQTSNLLFLCSSVLMSPALAVSDSRYGVSPYVS